MQTAPNIVIVPVDGDLDVSNIDTLRVQLRQLYRAGCRRIILNLAETHYVDSSGMGFIASESRRMRELGGLLSLLNVSDGVRKALGIVRLLDFVPISKLADKNAVPALDANARPEWQRSFSVNPTQLAAVRERVSQLLGSMPLSSDEVFDMTLAGGEALGNAVDHTDGQGIYVTVSRYADRAVMEVSDNGEGFEPPEDCTALVGECLERGRGIRLMQLLSDSVEFFKKSSGTGTVVRLVKLLDE